MKKKKLKKKDQIFLLKDELMHVQLFYKELVADILYGDIKADVDFSPGSGKGCDAHKRLVLLRAVVQSAKVLVTSHKKCAGETKKKSDVLRRDEDIQSLEGAVFDYESYEDGQDWASEYRAFQKTLVNCGR